MYRSVVFCIVVFVSPKMLRSGAQLLSCMFDCNLYVFVCLCSLSCHDIFAIPCHLFVNYNFFKQGLCIYRLTKYIHHLQYKYEQF